MYVGNPYNLLISLIYLGYLLYGDNIYELTQICQLIIIIQYFNIFCYFV